VRKGEIVLLATVEETRKLAARHVRVSFSEDVNVAPVSEVVEVRPRLWNLRIEGPLGPLLRQLAALPVHDIEVAEPKLEDVIMKYYRGANQ
jgi:hypothetical protein